ncbi:OmpA family protein [Niveibacterium sp. 24ML]|uniref:OmpA family protein n=1 Tax=Niveibacterium sp. 24ML TaxID=2985512 RepID=UPI00227141C0|nr:OmpA family protein [Niveibacterium sp. 24ML]MCX9156627.1 OmpA family protein [Niveibacterium sp. 24ML]
MTRFRAPLISALLIGALGYLPQASAEDVVDLGTKVPDAKTVSEGLFPEDSCKELEASGFKCMGFKPAVRFSLPGASFARGSAELSDQLRNQLDAFAEVLKTRTDSSYKIVIEGHTDITGPDDLNEKLSYRRAQAVKNYLVAKGASPAQLEAAGMGSKKLRNPKDPEGGENRRVEIGRQK